MSYDEDLSQNPFFKELQEEHEQLFRQCITESWVLCVPRISTILSQVFTLQDFLGHILIRDEELPHTHFMTLTDKVVRVVDRVLSLEKTSPGLPSQIQILFEETFYTTDKEKYVVWCIEFPLELEYNMKSENVSQCKTLCTLRDCIDYLWTETSGKEVLQSMDSQINDCKSQLSDTNNKTLYILKETVNEVYKNCLQSVLENKKLKEKCINCKNTMDNVKLSVETYLHHGLYKELFESLSTITALEDSNLNKTIRNSSDLQLQDLQIKQEFFDCIPAARKNLSLIQSYSTVLGKVNCIRSTITTINKTSKKSSQSDLYVSTDDLLPILIFLVLKSGVANWIAHLNFLRHFRFSVHSLFESDECSYCISTLEAIIEQIKSGLNSPSSYTETQCFLSDNDESFEFEFLELNNSDNISTTTTLNKEKEECRNNLQYLLEQIKLSNFDKVKEILEQNKHFKLNNDVLDLSVSLDQKFVSLEDVFNDDDFGESSNMCHPLCTCLKCCRLVSNNLIKNSPTISSKDSLGFTALHIATICNEIHIVDMILEMGADSDCADNSGSTPLHYAALKGHQTTMLLLLHVGADFNQQNLDKNTPLHLACNNGHDLCVKALIYFCEQSKNDLNLQAVNENGDTALHLASKWGYQTIVRVLLENSAEPWIKNCKGKTSLDVAHSRVITNLLTSVLPNMSEYVHVSFDSDLKQTQIKSDVILLDLNEDSPVKTSNVSSRTLLHISPPEPTKPRNMEDIHHIERLFHSIAFGDVKLACFYMNIDFDLYNNSSDTVKNIKKKSKTDLCHPLCSCVKCTQRLPSERNENFNINMCDSKGNTSLHIAAKHNRLEICDILLNNGAVPDIKNNIGMTALHIAAKDNKISLMKLLLKQFTNISLKDSAGNTALHLACRSGSIEAVQLLLTIEPYREIRNLSRKTPLDEAKDRIHLTIIDLLEKNLKMK